MPVGREAQKKRKKFGNAKLKQILNICDRILLTGADFNANHYSRDRD